MNIVCFGDSITHAAGFAESDRWPTILQGKMNEWRKGDYKVFNRGIGGHTSVQAFDRFASDVAPHLPAVVLIEFGFNDACCYEWSRICRVGRDEFILKMREICRAVREKGGRPVLIVNHTIKADVSLPGNERSYNENLDSLNECIKQIASDMEVDLIDLPAMMNARNIDIKAFLSSGDGLHLSEEGNHEYADMVFEALREMLA